MDAQASEVMLNLPWVAVTAPRKSAHFSALLATNRSETISIGAFESAEPPAEKRPAAHGADGVQRPNAARMIAMNFLESFHFCFGLGRHLYTQSSVEIKSAKQIAAGPPNPRRPMPARSAVSPATRTVADARTWTAPK